MRVQWGGTPQRGSQRWPWKTRFSLSFSWPLVTPLNCPKGSTKAVTPCLRVSTAANDHSNTYKGEHLFGVAGLQFRVSIHYHYGGT